MNDVVLDDNLQWVPPGVQVLQNNIIKALWKAYPAWKNDWYVAIDTEGGIIQIRNMAISGRMGFVMKIAEVDPEMRKVVRYAGELFERYNIARKKGVDIRQALADVKRTGFREPIYEKD